jgi:hypothetical protein
VRYPEPETPVPQGQESAKGHDQGADPDQGDKRLPINPRVDRVIDWRYDATQADLNRAEATNNSMVPVGGIIMWTGSTAPVGWGLCNGTIYARIAGRHEEV